jgi:hypothetical protein
VFSKLVAELPAAAAVLRSARRSESRLAAVVGLFDRVDAGLELIERPVLGHDEYDYMVETLIRTFLKERYASLQLSERQARAEVLELRAIRAQMNPHFLYISSVDKFPVTLGLRLSIDAMGIPPWNEIAAMSVVAILPSVIIFFSSQKYFVEGIATTGLKG